MGQHRQQQKAREAMGVLNRSRVELLAATLGERTTALIAAETAAADLYMTSRGSHGSTVPRSMLWAAAQETQRQAERYVEHAGPPWREPHDS